MQSPSIFLITKSEKVCETLENNLKMYFGSKIRIDSCSEQRELDVAALAAADLVLVSAKGVMDTVTQSKVQVPAIIARRTVELPKLEQLMDLPAGTRCLFVSNSMATAEDSIELLMRLGFEHLHFTPYVPQPNQPLPEFGQVDVAVTHGLKELVPESIDKIIDLDTRPLDLTTIFDIAQRLNLPIDKAHYYTAEFFRDFVRLGRNLANSVINGKRLNQKLESVLNAVHEGIIGIDERGYINVFNEHAEKILKLSAHNCIGDTFWHVIPEFKMHEIFQSQTEELNQLIETRNLVLLVSKVPLILDGEFLGAVVTFQDVTKVQRIEQEIRKQSTHLGLTTKYSFQHIIGVSPSIAAVRQVAAKLAESDFTVLITGDNGTGKEVFAQALHQHSPRRDGPFVPVNFAGLTESLAESELFGYEEGSFTGAKRGGKMGLFELAHNGTIFLDEIGDAPLSIQAALLRVLQERQVMRVGGNRVIPINVRVIAATNRNLIDMVTSGAFREDLYYRLNVLPLHIPNLRERREDLFILIEYFLHNKRKHLTFTPEAKNILLNYNWPGNIRELENFINYLIVITEGDKVQLEHIPERITKYRSTVSSDSMQQSQASRDEVDDIVHSLQRKGSLADYEDILTCLWTCSRRNERVGRSALSSLLSRPLSESQLRSKLAILKNCGCITVGIKKQGTSITALGIEVLQKIKETVGK